LQYIYRPLTANANIYCSSTFLAHIMNPVSVDASARLGGDETLGIVASAER
jgi:hypothetical protein